MDKGGFVGPVESVLPAGDSGFDRFCFGSAMPSKMLSGTNSRSWCTLSKRASCESREAAR